MSGIIGSTGWGWPRALDLGLLVRAEDHRTLGRVEVQTDDVVDLLHEQRIRRQLERIRQVGLEVELPPAPADRRLRQATRCAMEERDQ